MNAIEPATAQGPDAIQPLPGEPGIPDVATAPRPPFSRKAMFAIAFAVVSLIAVTAISVQRMSASWSRHDDSAKQNADRPAVTSGDLKRLDLSTRAPTPATPASTSSTRIPAIVPIEGDPDPIGIRRAGPNPSEAAAPSKPSLPEDAPAVLLSNGTTGSAATTRGRSENVPSDAGPLAQTRRNLEGYERRLQALLDAQSTGGAPAMREQAHGSGTGTPIGGNPPGTGLFGGQLQGSATPRVSAGTLGDRSLILPRGTVFTCALKTKLVSAASGFIGCQVQRNIFGDDGRVLLVDRGSHLDGEYRVASVKPGTVRIPVVWTRLRTPNGITVEFDSPGTGPLGESGIDGYVDNRWPERIGAALLLSLIDDTVQLALRRETDPSQVGAIVMPSTTANTSKLADKVLDSTINIPPLIYQNQGGVVGIYVARDVDFSSVYELKAVPR